MEQPPLTPPALKLLRALAGRTEPVLIHVGRPRTIWRLVSADGPAAPDTVFAVLVSAGYVEIIYGRIGGRRIAITADGRDRLAGAHGAAPADQREGRRDGT